MAAIPQAPLAVRAPFIRGYFGLPDSPLVVCGVSFGYADTEYAANGFRTGRATLNDGFGALLRHDRPD